MSILDVFKKKKAGEKKVEKQEVSKSASSISSEAPPAGRGEARKKVPERQRGVLLFKKGSSKEQSLLVKPYQSEKFTFLKEQQNKYVFEVSPKATKNEIKKLLENIYNVEISKINVTNASPKPKRWRQKKSYPKRNKRMIVTLKEGQKIELGI